MGRSIVPRCWSIRFIPLTCTHAPWGLRVDGLAKSRKIPTRRKLPFICWSRPNDDGQTPLYTAACRGHLDVVAALLEHPGIATNGPCKLGHTPLRAAADEGHGEVVKALLAAGGIAVNDVSVWDVWVARSGIQPPVAGDGRGSPTPTASAGSRPAFYDPETGTWVMQPPETHAKSSAVAEAMHSRPKHGGGGGGGSGDAWRSIGETHQRWIASNGHPPATTRGASPGAEADDGAPPQPPDAGSTSRSGLGLGRFQRAGRPTDPGHGAPRSRATTRPTARAALSALRPRPRTAFVVNEAYQGPASAPLRERDATATTTAPTAAGLDTPEAGPGSVPGLVVVNEAYQGPGSAGGTGPLLLPASADTSARHAGDTASVLALRRPGGARTAASGASAPPRDAPTFAPAGTGLDAGLGTGLGTGLDVGLDAGLDTPGARPDARPPNPFAPAFRPVEARRTVRLSKGRVGFGFTVLQRVGARGALIASLTAGGPAAASRQLFPGDMVLSVNGEAMQGLPFAIITRRIKAAGPQPSGTTCSKQ